MDRREVIFFGSGAFGVPTLERLARTRGLAMIVTQPDRKAGRGGKLTPTPVGQWAAEHAPDVPILKPERVAEPELVDRIRSVDASAWVVIAYGQKLPPELLADRFAVNLHASRLPRWRGAAPINWAILAGDPTTGNSVITLAERMDAGLVLAQSERAVEPSVTTGELHDLLALDGPDLIERVLDQRDRDALQPITQDEALVTHARKLSKNDGRIDFREPAEEGRRRVHGLNPWPGVTVEHAGKGLKLHRVEAIDPAPESAGMSPGAIIDAEIGLVVCGEGSALRLHEVQPEGGRKMPWGDYARGRGDEAGSPLIGEEGAGSC